MSSTKTNNETVTCTICLDSIKEDRHETSCGHVYHKACLDEWLRNGSECPLCRKDLGGVRQRVSAGYLETVFNLNLNGGNRGSLRRIRRNSFTLPELGRLLRLLTELARTATDEVQIGEIRSARMMVLQRIHQLSQEQ